VLVTNKKAFTMIELIFVIVVIGILASVALPRLAATRTDAVLVKGKSTVASIRSAISIEKGLRLMRGDSGYPEILDDANINEDNQELFDGNDTDTVGVDPSDIISILDNPILSGTNSGNWMKISKIPNPIQYVFYVEGDQNVTFTYNPTRGSFNCDRTADRWCEDLIK